MPLTCPVLAESGERTRVDSKGQLDVRLREELIVLRRRAGEVGPLSFSSSFWLWACCEQAKALG